MAEKGKKWKGLEISTRISKAISSLAERPTTLSLGPPSDPSDNNFFTQQARLQIEARMALAQAKDMAHMQMEVNFELLVRDPFD